MEAGDLSGLILFEPRVRGLHPTRPIALWRVRPIAEIHRISNSAEMRAWDVSGSYSRPICRRIAEEAGVPREAFGMTKRASAVYPLCREFLSASSTALYLDWLRERRGAWLRRRRVPPLTSVHVDRAIVVLTALIEHGMEGVTRSIASSTGWSRLPQYPKVKRLRTPMHSNATEAAWLPPLRRYVFPWALSLAKARYENAVQ